MSDHYARGGKHYVTKHIFADGTRIADKIDDATFMHKPPVFYYHADHLGSSHYVSNGDQDLVEHHEYFASGEQWDNVVDDQFLFRRATTFNDKEFDPLTGYYYFGQRYYEPRLGAWESPDPILGDYMQGDGKRGVFQTRNLDSYTYAWNNPVVVHDLDGRQALNKQQREAASRGAAIIHLVNRSGASAAEIRNLAKGLSAELKGIGDVDPIVTAGPVPSEFAQSTLTLFVGNRQDATTKKGKKIADDIFAGVPTDKNLLDAKGNIVTPEKEHQDIVDSVKKQLASGAGVSFKEAKRGVITFTGHKKDRLTALANQAKHEAGHLISQRDGDTDHKTHGVMGSDSNDWGILDGNDAFVEQHYKDDFREILKEGLKAIQDEALKTP